MIARHRRAPRDPVRRWRSSYLLKAFANGGSSLTGLEAISNGVSAFKTPDGLNARRTLSIMSLLLGSLVLGISFLACADPRDALRERLPDGDQPGGRGRLRPRLVRPPRLRRRADRDRADPAHRREHPVHRLPVPGQLHRRGLVPAPAADPARAPAGLQQRHHRADGRRAGPAARASARTSTSSSRSTPSACSPASRWPASAWPSTTAPTREDGLAPQAGDQLRGRRGVGAGRADLRGGEVHRGRLAGRASSSRSAGCC